MFPFCRAIQLGLCRLPTLALASRQFPLPYCPLRKMNPGKNGAWSPAGSYPGLPNDPSSNGSSGGENRDLDNRSQLSKQSIERYNMHQPMSTRQYSSSSGVGGIKSEQSQSSNLLDLNNDEEYPPLSGNIGSSSKGLHASKRRSRTYLGLENRTGDIASPSDESSLQAHFGNKGTHAYPNQSNSGQREPQHAVVDDKFNSLKVSPKANNFSMGLQRGRNVAGQRVYVMKNQESRIPMEQASDESSLTIDSVKKAIDTNAKESPYGQKRYRNAAGINRSSFSKGPPKVERFSICMRASRNVAGQILRSGMVLLKGYISLYEQMQIVKTCHQLGDGPGGFYRPGYKDGAKLHLYMMCLGLNWDPQTKKYEKLHQIDKCEPPDIPNEFCLLVQRAIQDANNVIKREAFPVSNVEDILPAISPDICIVNFYTSTGRLGLHQDRDESKESIQKGLPVVSFSIGDSAEFLYGDDRDVDKAEKVVLESGDVLIFGGKSRRVFHGVSSIIPNSAPDSLLAETGLLPGRLNLTFRQY